MDFSHDVSIPKIWNLVWPHLANLKLSIGDDLRSSSHCSWSFRLWRRIIAATGKELTSKLPILALERSAIPVKNVETAKSNGQVAQVKLTCSWDNSLDNLRESEFSIVESVCNQLDSVRTWRRPVTAILSVGSASRDHWITAQIAAHRCCKPGCHLGEVATPPPENHRMTSCHWLDWIRKDLILQGWSLGKFVGHHGSCETLGLPAAFSFESGILKSRVTRQMAHCQTAFGCKRPRNSK